MFKDTRCSSTHYWIILPIEIWNSAINIYWFPTDILLLLVIYQLKNVFWNVWKPAKIIDTLPEKCVHRHFFHTVSQGLQNPWNHFINLWSNLPSHFLNTSEFTLRMEALNYPTWLLSCINPYILILLQVLMCFYF